jgi:hypothetical protein
MPTTTDSALTVPFPRDEFAIALAALASHPRRRRPEPPIDWVLGPSPCGLEPPTEVVATIPRETPYGDEATTVVDWSEEEVVRAERAGRRRK